MNPIEPLIAGNWKMHKLPTEAESWAYTFREALAQETLRAEVAICAPFTHLRALAAILEDSPVRVGAQDVSAHAEGAYTGEVSAAMLKDAGVSYVIVGHSERRQYHRETDALIHEKVARVLEQGLVPILCVGESEAEREAGEAEAVVLAQVRAALEDVRLSSPDALVVAYEPVWAIGTGKTATADDAQEMGAALRGALSDLYGEVGRGLRLLYGGSMKPGNAGELLSKPDVGGGLVGGASLDIEAFLGILRAA